MAVVDRWSLFRGWSMIQRLKLVFQNCSRCGQVVVSSGWLFYQKKYFIFFHFISSTLIYLRGLKHAARQMHLSGPRMFQNYEFWLNLACFESLYCKLHPTKIFFQINFGPRNIFSLECGPPKDLSLIPPDLSK